MKVFISYGATEDQVTALRLQALGVVNGLTIYVPPAHTRQGQQSLLEPQSAQKLREAEVILGVVVAGLSQACQAELNLAIGMGKAAIVMADPKFAPNLQPAFGPNLVVIDPANPASAELGIVQHLKAMNAHQSATQALLALGTLALGLLIFAPTE